VSEDVVGNLVITTQGQDYKIWYWFSLKNAEGVSVTGLQDWYRFSLKNAFGV
jgi:hypothetical protein